MRIPKVLAVVVAVVASLVVTAPSAVAQGDGDQVVIAAGNRGSEYNISSGSQLSAVRSMLLDSASFGPDGTVEVPTVTIKEDVSSIDASYLEGVHVLFDGWDRSRNWSNAEKAAVEAWVRAGGVLVSTNDDPEWDALGEHFGAPTIRRTSGDYSAASTSHPVVSGPFGSWSSIRTAGWISHLGSPSGFTVIANDRDGNAAIVEAAVGDGHVIVLADEGPLRMATSGANRVFAGNLFAHAISLSDAPSLTPVVPDPTPTPEPTPEPTEEPTATPEPTAEPTEEPTATPEPTEEPTATPEPTEEPTAEPTAEPTEEPTVVPDPTPTPEPTAAPPTPTPEPTTPPSDEPTLELVTDTMASIVAGDEAWVALTWRALADVEDLQVTISNDAGVTVGYPENTVDHAGPAEDTGIAMGRSDYTAFLLNVPASATDGVALTANVSWTALGERHTAAIDVKLPTVEFTGQDLEVMTGEASVQDGWLVVQYRGLAPQVSGLQLRVTDGADVVEYPQGDHTSLSDDATLDDGETDLARFYVGDAVAPGAELSLSTVYERAGERRELTHTLTVRA